MHQIAIDLGTHRHFDQLVVHIACHPRLGRKLDPLVRAHIAMITRLIV